MNCAVCGGRAVVEVNFNGNAHYAYCTAHNRIKKGEWVVTAGWAKTQEGKKYWKEQNFHPASVKRL